LHLYAMLEIISRMDTTKWKSILVPMPVYRQIKEIAQIEDRTISGQLRKIFNEWKEDRAREARELDSA
tara:strand:- start:146 stop:349 length:204 start_codon:yes stop_codon:yes gene_type:complete